MSRSALDSSGTEQPLAGCRVLVVEDEFIIALELQATLEEAGAVVVGPAYTLGSAVELARTADLSAAMLDLRLARDSVRPVARILGERGIPFMFYTGQPTSDPIRADWPNCTTISKPAKPEVLVNAVAGLFAVDD